MKRKIKNMLGVVMALTMATSTSAFAGVQSHEYTGSIGEESVKINIGLPTAGDLTVKPYGKVQIDTGIGYIDNKWANDGSEADAVVYNLSIAGYTAVLGTKGETAPVLVDTIDTKLATKQVKMAIQVAPAESSGSKTSDISDATKRKDWDDKFAADTMASLDIKRASEESYNPSNPDSVYTKTTETTPKTIAIKPAQSAPVRVYGTMNVNANWEVGDEITVTPVFNVAPDPSAKID